MTIFEPRRRPRILIASLSANAPDGVSVEIAKWLPVLRAMGMAVTVAAACGEPDVVIDLLGRKPDRSASAGKWEELVGSADIVIVHNLFTIPLGLPAFSYLEQSLARRVVIAHHHDIPWDRPVAPPAGFPPDHEGWFHVVNSRRGLERFAAHGIRASLVPNIFDTDPPAGDRSGTRRRMGIADGELLVLHPTRAIPRKEVPTALRVAEALGGCYWLAGPAADGYGSQLDEVLRASSVRVLRGIEGRSMDDAYAAADVVVYPSSIEGFGNPVIEAAIRRKPLIGAGFPVAAEFAANGLRWFTTEQIRQLRAWLDDPDLRLLERNRAIAVREYSADAVAPLMESVLRRAIESATARVGQPNA